MPRSIFFRVKGSQDWERVTLASNPFEISGYAQGTVFEIDDGTGIIQEITTLLSPKTATPPSLLPAFGPVGTVFQINKGSYTGTQPVTVTGVLTLNGVNVTSQIEDDEYVSTATGPVVWTETASNGINPPAVEMASAAVVVIPTVSSPISNQQMLVGDANRTINLSNHFANATSYTVTPTGQGATISGSTLTITASAARNVTYTIVGRSVDNFTVDLNFNTVVTVPVINPTVSLAIPDTAMYVGDATRTINLNNHFANAVSYSVSPVGQGVTVSGTILSITTAAERNANFTVTATSNTGHTVTDIFNLIITVNTAANDTPQLTAVKSIFTNNRKGAIYNVKMEHCFRDAAGTIPVTAVGQDVMYIRDLSGNGMHLSQTDAARAMIYDVSNGMPALRRKNDNSTLTRASFATDSVTKMTVTVGARKVTNTFATIMGFGDVNATPGSFEIIHGTSVGDANRRSWGSYLRGSSGRLATSSVLYDGDNTNVITTQMDFDGVANNNKVSMRVAGLEQDESYDSSAGLGDFSPKAITIGSKLNESSASTGFFFGAVIAAGSITGTQLSQIETFINSITFSQPVSTLTSLRAEQDGFSVISIDTIADLTFTPNEDGFSVAGFPTT